MHSSTMPQPLERGVYKAWWRIDGHEVLYAVTSSGERVKRIIVLRAGVSEARAIAWFEEILDRIDPPRPRLELVTPAHVPPQAPAHAPKQITLEQLDALYRDASPFSAALWRRKRDRYRGNAGTAPSFVIFTRASASPPSP